MTIGTVQDFARSRNNAAQVKIDGKYYFIGKCNVDGLEKGAKIDFEFNTFGDRGTLLGLQTWKLAGQPQNNPPQSRNNPLASQESTGARMDGDELRFISNVVGQAIAAKTITEPGQLAKWFRAAHAVVTFAPEFNDDIP